jgi:hypothetical protein
MTEDLTKISLEEVLAILEKDPDYKAVVKKIRSLIDARRLTESYENMPVQPNLNDPSLPGTKT